MESVVITVSGYKGSERFDLIKLIDKAGANYVGTMNESITHLVCWKYEGRKYELARKFKTLIVNHQWVEECIRKGRRVPEGPYTTKSGQEVGPLVLNVSFISEQFLHHSNLQRKPKQIEAELRCEEFIQTVRSDSDFLHKCELKFNKHRPQQKIRKRSSGVQKSDSSRCPFDEFPSPGFLRVEASLLADSRKLSRQTKRDSASAEPSSKGRKRRLVKKNITREPLEISSDSEEDNIPLSSDQEHTPVGYANILDVERHKDVSGCGYHEYGKDCGKAFVGIDKTVDANDVLHDEDKCLHGNGTSSSNSATGNQKVNSIGGATRLPAATELSCVICWTDFSDTRGVLPCGHRFCFACIQSWADHMLSSGKTSTCPLCKASFMSITKMDGAVPSDQKIYSQTIPLDDSRMDIYILPGGEPFDSGPRGAPYCCRCACVEPEDLLVPCHLCQIRYIHSYCQDPPVSPWACGHCKDLQMLYMHVR